MLAFLPLKKGLTRTWWLYGQELACFEVEWCRWPEGVVVRAFPRLVIGSSCHSARTPRREVIQGRGEGGREVGCDSGAPSCQLSRRRITRRGALDQSWRATALKGGKSGTAIVPGSPDESLLVEKVVEAEMPPKGLLPARSKWWLCEPGWRLGVHCMRSQRSRARDGPVRTGGLLRPIRVISPPESPATPAGAGILRGRLGPRRLIDVFVLAGWWPTDRHPGLGRRPLPRHSPCHV